MNISSCCRFSGVIFPRYKRRYKQRFDAIHSGELILATGQVTNAGNVYVSSGTLALVDPVTLTNDPGIILSSATLDVRGAGGTMTRFRWVLGGA